MKFFSIDSPFYKFMQRLLDVFVLNLMWLLFSLPVITIGCSTIAAFDVSLKMSEEREGHIARGFIKAFASNWKQGIPMGIITLVAVYAVYLDIQLIRADLENSYIFLIIGLVSIYFIVLSLLYAYPLLARYENTVLNCIKNSFRLSMKFFGSTLLLILLLAVEFVIIFWNGTTMFVGLLIGPASVIFTVSATAIRIFRETEKTPGAVTRKSQDDEDL